MKTQILSVLLLLMSFSVSGYGHDSFYSVIGVPSNAKADEIKKAWRLKVKTLHPDRAGDNELIRALNAAENVLGNAEFRAYYDHFSNKGINHERWEQLPGKNILSDLKAKYGPADSLKQRLAPKAGETLSFNEILSILKNRRTPENIWIENLNKYFEAIQGEETDPSRQNEMLELFTPARGPPKHESHFADDSLQQHFEDFQ